MSCKDCIHWKACKALQHTWEKIEGTHYPLIAEKCKIFKDRSKFIELPCEVGDYVYCLNGKGEIRQFKIRCVKTTQSDINANPKNIVLTLGCNNTVGLLWFDSDKTKNIYFSKEKAEQALKEREKE